MIKTIILNKMTRNPVRIELIMMLSRLSDLKLIAMGANDRKIVIKYDLLPASRNRFTKELMRLSSLLVLVSHLPRPLVISGSFRISHVERGSGVATRGFLCMPF